MSPFSPLKLTTQSGSKQITNSRKCKNPLEHSVSKILVWLWFWVIDTNHLHEYKADFEQPETNMLWNQQNQISHSNIKRNEPRILQWAIIWQLVSHSQAFCHWQHKPMADEAKLTWRSFYPTLVVEPFLHKILHYFGLYWHSVNSDFKNNKKIIKKKNKRK